MSRPSNPEVCAAFRKLLTEGCPVELREASKPWRGAMWKAFSELERRLCPAPPSVQPVAPSVDDRSGAGYEE